MSTVKDIDRGFRQLVRNFVRMRRGPNVTVGIQGDEAMEQRDGITNANLAAVHEFGSADGSIPQRSFIRGTTDRERAKINRLLERAVKAGVRGDVRRELGKVGEVIRAAMVRTIDQSIGIKANAPATIARKGSSVPLIDTGVLKGAISWEYHAS